MRITKYPQSCLLIETKNKRILVDPGYINFNPDWLSTVWSKIDIILITHKHTDHCHEEAIRHLQSKGTPILASKEVSNAYPNLRVQIIKAGDSLNSAGPKHPEAGIKIEITRAVHGYLSSLKGGREIHENIGFIIDDGSKRLYITSDTIGFPNEYTCDIIAIPVSSHGLVFGPYDGALFAKDTKATLAIPIHCDNPKYPADIETVKSEFDKVQVMYKFLQIGESIEV